MSNNISGNFNNLSTELRSRTAAPSSSDSQVSKPATPVAPVTDAVDDSVQISDSTKQLASQVERELKNFPAVDAAKVERLKAQIDAGDYFPDGVEIANKILLMERAIAQKPDSE